MCRATASMGKPRAATYAPPSSQLPRWPVTTMRPLPSGERAARRDPIPSPTRTSREHLLARVRRQNRGLDRSCARGCAYDARAMRSISGARQIGKRGRELPLDDGAPDPERRVAELADALADRAGAREAEPLHGRDGAAQSPRIRRDARTSVEASAPPRSRRRSIWSDRPPRSPRARIRRSSRSRRTRAARACGRRCPSPARCLSPERNDATVDAVYDGSPGAQQDCR